MEWLPVPAADSFIQSGSGDHSIEPANHFTYVDADDAPEDLHATVEGIAKVKLSGPPAAPRHVHDKRLHRPLYDGECTREERKKMELAIISARRDLNRGWNNIHKLKESDNDWWAELYKRWFGPFTKRRHKVATTMILYIERKVRFRDFSILCRTGERATVPAKLSNYTLQLWDCYSVTDTPLDQSSRPECYNSWSTEGSGTARSLPR